MDRVLEKFTTAMMRKITLVAAVLILTGCATISDKDRHASSKYPTPNPHPKIGNPYVIKGRTYVPRADPSYVETGIASWYGSQFHGKLTANGELYDMKRLTAAHRTLPLPSLVRVTNLENGRSAVLRVNDRGPFANERIIDLSRGAAERLGTKVQGLARVKVEYLGAAKMSDAITTIGAPENYAALHTPMLDTAPQPRRQPNRAINLAQSTPESRPREPISPTMHAPKLATAAASPSADGYYVRIGSFADISNVRSIRDRLPPIIPVHVTSSNSDSQQIHHVRLGPYTHEFAAIEAKRVAEMQGFSDAHIVRETRAP